MEISVETTEGLNRLVTVEVPIKALEEEQNKRLKKIAKTAKIDGFRPGKVPLKILEQRYGASIRQEALTQVVSSTLFEALTQKDLHPVKQPKIEIKTYEPDKPLQYSAKFEVYPEIKPVTLDNVKIETIQSEITEADIDKALENLRKQHAIWEEVTRPAQENDKVIIDFEGFIDGQPFEGGKASETPVVLGSNSMIPKFEAGIVGTKTGDEFEIEAQFPNNYFNHDLAGKAATFKIKLHKILEPHLPELNDEFLENLNIEGGLDTLKENIRTMMETELKQVLKYRNKKIVLDQLLKLNQFDIPKLLLEVEIEHLRQQATQRIMQYTQKKIKMPEMPRELFEREATRRVMIGLLFNELVKLYNISPSKERIQTMLTEIASQHDQPEKIVAWYAADPKRLEQVKASAIEEDLINQLLETAQITEKKISFEELVKLPDESTDTESVISF
jgi:trigger factor